MPVNWFQSQQAMEAPVAPYSSQQAAARWEPSIQDFVSELGGHTVAELQECIDSRWATKFDVYKVWKGMDAISDKGLHSYLQHHWVILQLLPREASKVAPPEGEANPSNGCQDSNDLFWPGSEAHPPSNFVRADDILQAGLDNGGASDISFKRKRSETDGAQPLLPVPPQTQPQSKDESNLSLRRVSADQAEAQLNDQQVLLTSKAGGRTQREESGLLLAERGLPWFLRIDRFNENDKWFACSSFQGAMESEQARLQHFRPTSEVAFEARPETLPLPLECIVPTLQRLASIKYSVFAKGNHCQWHARVLTVLTASLYHFLSPTTPADSNFKQVSKILVDGWEQQRYSAAAGKNGDMENAYLRAFPEAPFLRQAIADLKASAKLDQRPEMLAAAQKPFPDLQFVYASISA